MKPHLIALVFLLALPVAAGPPGDEALRKLLGRDDGTVVPLWPGDGVRPDDPATDLAETLQKKGDDKLRITGVTKPTLHLWPAPKPDGRAVIIFPGGGYNILAAQHEGTEVAEWLNSQGITAFVAKYRVPRRKGREPHAAALQDAQRAIRLVRTRAAEFGIDPGRIGVLGFSAGGNLAALTIHHAGKPAYEAIDAIDQASARPDFAVLIYPAYLAADRDGDGLHPSVAPLPHRSDYPPIFIATAADDRFTTGALRYYLHLNQRKAPGELHVYAKGGHGKGLRKDGYPFSTWALPCARWLADLEAGTIGPPRP
ncbi:MAG: alpha/beta hydrolase [Akkermansiaceae bacterium]|nr:alpha/beta hydrolase [Akkermansiaceae bacterium]